MALRARRAAIARFAGCAMGSNRGRGRKDLPHAHGFLKKYRWKIVRDCESRAVPILRSVVMRQKDSRLLLQLHAAARILELLFDLFGFGLIQAFLDRFGGAVDQVLRLFQAKSGQLAHYLDHLDLLVA